MKHQVELGYATSIQITIQGTSTLADKVERGNFGHMHNSGQRSSKGKCIEQRGNNCSSSTSS